MGQPRVSVLMPVYNGARFLDEALNSVYAQTFTDFEVVVVDDGSTDGTAQILRRHEAAEPRLTLLRQENAGISAALNAGLAMCRGELVARMDADDVMLPRRLASQVSFLDKHPELGFCGSTIEYVDARGHRFGRRASGPHDLAQLERLVARRRRFSYTHPAVMFRRADVVAAGGYRATFEPCEDLDLFLRLIDSGRPGIDVSQPLLRYRVHGSSLSASNALTQIRMRKLLFHNFYAAREGRPTQDYTTFVSSGPASGLRTRWSDGADALGAVAGYRIAGGRPLSGWVLGGVAVLMTARRRLRARTTELLTRRRRAAEPPGPAARPDQH